MKAFTPTLTATTFVLPVRDLLAVWNATSKEEVRYYLGGVFIDVADGAITMTATTGAILLTKGVDPRSHVGSATLTQENGFILKVDVLEKALKSNNLANLWMHGDTETGIIQTFHLDDSLEVEQYRTGVCEFERIDGTFPEWRRVLPLETKEISRVNVDIHLLTAFQKVCKLYAIKGVSFKAGASERDPIKVDFPEVEGLTGVVMPYNI